MPILRKYECSNCRIQVVMETGLFKHWIRSSTDRLKRIMSRSKKTARQLEADRLVCQFRTGGHLVGLKTNFNMDLVHGTPEESHLP